MSKRAERVWLRLSQWYGARWIETYGPKPTEDWVRAVNASTDPQMVSALASIRTKHLSHPPTLPEFEAALRTARPAAGREAGGEGIIERLDRAFQRAFRLSPWQLRKFTWLRHRDSEGTLAIVGVMVAADPDNAESYPARRLLANEITP